jgi:dipeptidase E
MVDAQILAMGGGGFSMEPDNPLLDDYLLSLAPAGRKPRVCFVPTASGDSDGYSEKFLAAFGPERAEATILSLFNRTVADLDAFVLEQDIIYVGGGNTANLLAVWRVHGLDELLRAACDDGAVLAGISAG